MYSSGPATNGFAPMGSSGGSFLGGIPWWVYLIVILVGLAISIFCFVKYGAARRQAALAPLPGSPPPLPGAPPPLPGAPPPLAGTPLPGGGNGFLIGGIASAALLVLAPLIVMLIVQPWNSNWLVGRWGQNAACTGETVEFTSDGFVIARNDRKPYLLDGDQITVEGRTQTIRHDGDQFTVDGETFMRCSGSAPQASAAPSTPVGAPAAPSMGTPPSATGQAAGVPVPEYASWMLGRWSSGSDCTRSMEFRADGTATNSRGEPATFTVTPNGAGVGITIQAGGNRLAGYMDPDGGSGAILRAYEPSSETLNLHRC